jgi:heterogeneous nuclear ribonucleoprotein A1/A3
MKDKKSRLPKGFGFVVFKSDKVLNKIKNINHVLNGRTLDINVACKKDEDPQMVKNRRQE